MTLTDTPRFESAFQRLARVERLGIDQDTMRDWWAQLEHYPIDAVVSALQSAPAEREQRGDRLMTAGLVEGLCKKHLASISHERLTRYVPQGQATISAPGRRIDGATVTVVMAEYRCHLCEDVGWRARVTETGELLTAADLQARTNPHPADGLERLTSADYRMSRCQCRRRP